MEQQKKRKKLYNKSIEKRFLKKRFEFRLSENELVELKEKADEVGLKTSEYVRKKVMDKSGVAFNPKELIQAFFNYTGAVNKVGGNINQVTNYINYLRIQNKVSQKELIEFNILFHRFLEITEGLSTIMKREIKNLK